MAVAVAAVEPVVRSSWWSSKHRAVATVPAVPAVVVEGHVEVEEHAMVEGHAVVEEHAKEEGHEEATATQAHAHVQVDTHARRGYITAVCWTLSRRLPAS